METIIKKITENEDFGTVEQSHNIVTPYLAYKRLKAEGKDV